MCNRRETKGVACVNQPEARSATPACAMQTPRTLAPDNITLDLAPCSPSSPRAWIATAGATRPAPPPRRVSTASPSRDARLRGRASRDRSRPARRVRSGCTDHRGVLPVPPSHDRTLTSAPRSRRPRPGTNRTPCPRSVVPMVATSPPARVVTCVPPTARRIARRDRTREPRSRVRVFAPNARAALPDDAPSDPPRPGVRPAPRRAPAVNDRAPPAVAVSHPAAVPDHRDALGRPGRPTQR